MYANERAAENPRLLDATNEKTFRSLVTNQKCHNNKMTGASRLGIN